MGSPWAPPLFLLETSDAPPRRPPDHEYQVAVFDDCYLAMDSWSRCHFGSVGR